MSGWNEAIEKAAEEVECVDWILPLQTEERVNDFAKEVVKIVIGQCARAVRRLARPAGDELLLNRSAVRAIICQIPNGDLAAMVLKEIDALPIIGGAVVAPTGQSAPSPAETEK